jgi:hypothetical protein
MLKKGPPHPIVPAFNPLLKGVWRDTSHLPHRHVVDVLSRGRRDFRYNPHLLPRRSFLDRSKLAEPQDRELK